MGPEKDIEMKSFKKILKSFFHNIIWKILNMAFDWHYSELRNKYNIHPSFRFNGMFIYFYGEGKIEIGENSYIGWYSTIQAGENLLVK